MDINALLIILTIAIANFITRFIAYFLIPKKVKIPNIISYLSDILPSAIIAMIIVYCLKDINLMVDGFKELIGVIVVAIFQILFKVPIISIIAGVGVYMFLVQNT